MNTYRDELKDAPPLAIGCPHSWGYCDIADTPCGKIGRENVTPDHCVDCWTQNIDQSKPLRIVYKDEKGNNVTMWVEGWFIHTYTNEPMCKVRVTREDGSVDSEEITNDEFYRRWALSEEG